MAFQHKCKSIHIVRPLNDSRQIYGHMIYIFAFNQLIKGSFDCFDFRQFRHNNFTSTSLYRKMGWSGTHLGWKPVAFYPK